MNWLDVISLEEAKAELVMTGINDRDAEIERLIKTSIEWVEQYTSYRLYERTETFIAYCSVTELPYYPIEVDSIAYKGVAYANYTTLQLPLSLKVYTPSQSVITSTVGYANRLDIPEPLVSACYKIITYLFENKDAYSVGLPIDVQILLNQWRRSATI